LNSKIIYTHDEAAKIIEYFEDILSRYNIYIPSPEDEDRDEDDMVGLYGSTYSELLDDIESKILSILELYNEPYVEIIEGEFSGEY
jgi:hypothetical protein